MKKSYKLFGMNVTLFETTENTSPDTLNVGSLANEHQTVKEVAFGRDTLILEPKKL